MAAEQARAGRQAGATNTRRERRPHVAIAVVNLPVEKDRRVIRECLALEGAGYRVTVICPRGGQRLRHLPGSRDTAIRSFRQPFAGDGVLSFAAEFAWAFLWVAWHLAVLVVRHRVVAAQVCNPPDVFWPLALAMRATGRGWIFDHHDLSPELYACKTGAPRPVVTRLLTWFERLSMRFASQVVATNESYRQIALTRGGCPPGRVTVVRNGPAAGEIAAPTGTDPATRRIVYVGVINEQDHVDRAVLAAERLAARRGRDGWEMVIAGDGECLPELRSMVDERGLGDLVRFTGWLQAPEVDALLRDATLGIQPDIFSDMTNLSTMAKTVEYMARGLPVVAVDLLETRRTAGDAGRYVATGSGDEFAEALDELLDDPSRLARMRAIARERFTSVLAWEHQAAAYLDVWRRVVPLPLATAATQPADRAVPVASPRHSS
ncbi:glycosyltransferase family 4 protein [Micromonospora sp. C28SCA-DRY-2]|uniref:glycosyltransferase family 4 protein n=1 Tax=Micromonospora sp. C28SCA-DRY-2 TaxID=3059522 RepID=UPI002676D2C2|nr:glycosyltransferase family 4 protein [Micromonospora sp. C28SCA-DRY-2]MDO3704285.1 glycosyltransferase family 4 protein [Micromonospora sp. C28SCA-DRY-2]